MQYKMAGTFFRLFVILLGLSHLMCLKAVPVTRIENIMQGPQVHLTPENSHKVVCTLIPYAYSFPCCLRHVKHCFLTRHHVNEFMFLLFKHRLSLRNTGTWRNQPLLRGWSWNSSIIPHQGLMVVTHQKHHSVLNAVGSCLYSIILYKWP
ncbi:hypothetical protein VIGAN_01459600 [Vigna angularis var. angularis]|uniref:Secreted protein n=1 Tax=Vigna angularis var. angularis TaxID=157739 RepID=A0A0S3R7K9_PHAAN|nr:hypothetical protein VIGAN_01459600 [Vigna angularis var. angularis]